MSNIIAIVKNWKFQLIGLSIAFSVLMIIAATTFAPVFLGSKQESVAGISETSQQPSQTVNTVTSSATLTPIISSSPTPKKGNNPTINLVSCQVDQVTWVNFPKPECDKIQKTLVNCQLNPPSNWYIMPKSKCDEIQKSPSSELVSCTTSDGVVHQFSKQTCATINSLKSITQSIKDSADYYASQMVAPTFSSGASYQGNPVPTANYSQYLTTPTQPPATPTCYQSWDDYFRDHPGYTNTSVVGAPPCR